MLQYKIGCLCAVVYDPDKFLRKAEISILVFDKMFRYVHYTTPGSSSYPRLQGWYRIRPQVQSTPDDSNLQGKLKKGSSYREFEENSRE